MTIEEFQKFISENPRVVVHQQSQGFPNLSVSDNLKMVADAVDLLGKDYKLLCLNFEWDDLRLFGHIQGEYCDYGLTLYLFKDGKEIFRDVGREHYYDAFYKEGNYGWTETVKKFAEWIKDKFNE